MSDASFIIKEKYKCAKSPIYYLNTYGYVFDAKKKKISKMQCFDYQERCVKDFHRFQNNIVLKSRQCLPGDTFVDTPDGSKAIQNIKLNDLIYSFNLEANQVEVDTVSDAWCSGEKQCVKIIFDNTKDAESGENHPFYEINKKDWIRAKDLKEGDEILNSKLEKSIVLKIENIGLKKCYDITVAKNENFLINGILVHNTGLSVITAGYVAWRLMFRYEEKIMIISNQGDGAMRFLEAVKQFIENTPEWLLPTSISKKNQTELEFSKPHGSWIKAKASSPDAGRGEALTMLVLDETAFIKDDEQIWLGAGMALSMTKGKCVMISTPNGASGLYHKTWVSAISRDNNFNNLEVHWTENPIASEGMEIRKDMRGNDYKWSPWYEEQCKRLGYDSVKIAQELDLSFEGSKYLAIENELIDKYEKKVRKTKPYLYIKYDFLYKGEAKAGTYTVDETNFHVWKKPEVGKSYIAAVDVARGDGNDYSTIQVLDVETLEQVAEYRERIGVDLFPYIIDWVGRTYNMAFIVVEANSFGLGVGYDLRDKFNYKRLFYSKNVQEMHVRSASDYKIPEGVEIPGFQTTRRSRPLLIKAIIEHMREGNLILHSPRLLSEMKTFIMKGERPEAEQGFNDDLIFALGLALYIRDTEYGNVAITSNMYKSMLDSIIVSNNSSISAPADDYVPGKRDPENIKKENSDPMIGGGLFIQNENVPDPDSDDDFSWLLK